MTSSPKVELWLSYSYVDGGSYRDMNCDVRHGGQSTSVTTLERAANRFELLEIFVHAIRAAHPDRVAILHGEEVCYISPGTLQGILEMKLTTKDLIIGS